MKDSDIRWDRIAAALLRKLPPEVVEDFLNSPEYLALPEKDRDQLAIADAELEEIERVKRQRARQEQAEENYRRRMAAEKGGQP
ncbi:hypothetical protein ACQEVF_59460 [Nonomuraea polychroma]|uniref:hypothetical protein n=1 Tax=Nonomuraea polychroma TaxID=46176 RepID=UPI003D8B5ABD